MHHLKLGNLWGKKPSLTNGLEAEKPEDMVPPLLSCWWGPPAALAHGIQWRSTQDIQWRHRTQEQPCFITAPLITNEVSKLQELTLARKHWSVHKGSPSWLRCLPLSLWGIRVPVQTFLKDTFKLSRSCFFCFVLKKTSRILIFYPLRNEWVQGALWEARSVFTHLHPICWNIIFWGISLLPSLSQK